jgi:hypothetical protein
LLDAVDAAAQQIAEDPQRFPVIEDDIQRCRVKRFPYCVYFRCLPDTIRILVTNRSNSSAVCVPNDELAHWPVVRVALGPCFQILKRDSRYSLNAWSVERK